MIMNLRTYTAVMVIALSWPGAPVAAPDGVTRAQVEQWLAGYGEAWETRDADKAAALFTESATYQDSPFNEPFQGRQGIHDYWSGVTADQRDVAFESEVLTTFGRSAMAHWSARFKSASSGATLYLDGVFLLEFDGDLCSSLREWWILKVDAPAKE